MEPIKNLFGEVFLDKVQSFDLKLHWRFLLTGSCGNSYNTCISICKTLLSSYFCWQRRIQNSVWHLGWRVMQNIFTVKGHWLCLRDVLSSMFGGVLNTPLLLFQIIFYWFSFNCLLLKPIQLLVSGIFKNLL